MSSFRSRELGMTTTIQEIISQLRQQISSLEELEDLLIAPLSSLGIPIPKSPTLLRISPPNIRQLGTLQSTILAQVYPVWEGHTTLCDLYFTPPKSSVDGQFGEQVRALLLHGLTLLATPPLSRFSIRLLEKLVQTYSLDQIWNITQHGGQEAQAGWDRALSVWMSIPGKVANSLLGSGMTGSRDIPEILSFEEHAIQTCLASERIVWSVASRARFEVPEESVVEKLTHIISKLISTGHFSESGTLFIPQASPCVGTRIVSVHARAYSTLWFQITKNLPGPQLQKFAVSLFNYLDSAQSRRPAPDVPHSSKVLHTFFGPASQAPSEIWHTLIGSGRTWSRKLVRGIVGWAAGVGTTPEETSEKGLAVLLEHVLARWVDPQYVTRALLSEHRYLTSLLVLTLGALTSIPAAPPYSPPSPSVDSFPETILDLNDLDPLEPTAPSPPMNSSIAPRVHPLVTSTLLSPAFLHAVGAYLSIQDQSVRRCGMLVAEIVSSGKAEFEDWDGDEEWAKWATDLRAESQNLFKSIQEDAEKADASQPKQSNEPITAAPDPQTSPTRLPVSAPSSEERNVSNDNHRIVPEPDSDDDSLIGYDSPSPTSSRAPSPTPSELADPTLRRKPILRPVYLAELVAVLTEAPKHVVEVQLSENFGGGGKKSRRGLGLTGGRGGGDAEDERGRVEMALEVGAELVRRKRGYGTELDETAKDLVQLFVALQDNFDLDQFEERRQDVLVALIVCCPIKAAPYVIEQFFHHQYSSVQRFTMLNALALGARELAGLPIPPSSLALNNKRPRVDFPSKVLPGQAHLQYLSAVDLPPLSTNQLATSNHRIEGMRTQVSAIVEDLSRQAITRSKQDTESGVPQAVRERALKLGARPSRSIVPIDSVSSGPSAPMALGYLSSQTPTVPFSQVAAEYFVAPIIARFWAHLRGSLDREAYGSASRIGTGVRTGTGTGLILSPLVLAHLLGTLSVLLHASRHAPAFLHVLGPDAAEVALTVGTQPMTHVKQDNSAEISEGKEKEARVLAGALELALTVLDGALELDGGRVFAMERAELLVGIRQWASAIFKALEKGEKVPGRGGVEEEKVVRIAAGVILTATRMMERWSSSMVAM